MCAFYLFQSEMVFLGGFKMFSLMLFRKNYKKYMCIMYIKEALTTALIENGNDETRNTTR